MDMSIVIFAPGESQWTIKNPPPRNPTPGPYLTLTEVRGPESGRNAPKSAQNPIFTHGDASYRSKIKPRSSGALQPQTETSQKFLEKG